jgi:hypothetical protein
MQQIQKALKIFIALITLHTVSINASDPIISAMIANNQGQVGNQAPSPNTESPIKGTLNRQLSLRRFAGNEFILDLLKTQDSEEIKKILNEAETKDLIHDFIEFSDGITRDDAPKHMFRIDSFAQRILEKFDILPSINDLIKPKGKEQLKKWEDLRHIALLKQRLRPLEQAQEAADKQEAAEHEEAKKRQQEADVALQKEEDERKAREEDEREAEEAARRQKEAEDAVIREAAAREVEEKRLQEATARLAQEEKERKQAEETARKEAADQEEIKKGRALLRTNSNRGSLRPSRTATPTPQDAPGDSTSPRQITRRDSSPQLPGSKSTPTADNDFTGKLLQRQQKEQEALQKAQEDKERAKREKKEQEAAALKVMEEAQRLATVAKQRHSSSPSVGRSAIMDAAMANAPVAMLATGLAPVSVAGSSQPSSPVIVPQNNLQSSQSATSPRASSRIRVSGILAPASMAAASIPPIPQPNNVIISGVSLQPVPSRTLPTVPMMGPMSAAAQNQQPASLQQGALASISPTSSQIAPVIPSQSTSQTGIVPPTHLNLNRLLQAQAATQQPTLQTSGPAVQPVVRLNTLLSPAQLQPSSFSASTRPAPIIVGPAHVRTVAQGMPLPQSGVAARATAVNPGISSPPRLPTHSPAPPPDPTLFDAEKKDKKGKVYYARKIAGYSLLGLAAYLAGKEFYLYYKEYKNRMVSINSVVV